jgi:Yip1 domain
MAEEVLERPRPDNLLDDFAGITDFLIDARGAARRLPRKWFWIAPIVVVSIIMLVCGIMNFPIVQQAMTNQPPPANANPEQFQNQMRIGFMIQRAASYCSPLLLIVILAVSALVIMASCVIIDIKPKFLEMFNLMAGLSVIDGLKVIATTVVLHMKGEPAGLADLQPALGLDIFVPTGTSKVLVALLGYLNVFGIWQIVMAILIFAAAYRVSKTKAAVAVVPLFALGLLLRLLGALFSRT